jgi:hypothetical protein
MGQRDIQAAHAACEQAQGFAPKTVRGDIE